MHKFLNLNTNKPFVVVIRQFFHVYDMFIIYENDEVAAGLQMVSGLLEDMATQQPFLELIWCLVPYSSIVDLF